MLYKMWKNVFNLLQISLIWLFQVKCSSSIMPRNLMSGALLISWFRNSILSGRLGIVFLLDLKIVKDDSSALRVSLFALNQFMSCIIMILPLDIMSFMLLLWKKIVVSSAKSLVLPSGQQIGRSLIKRRKRSGPKTEPCGTPQDIGRVFDL